MKTVLSSLMNMKIGLYLENSQFIEGVLLSVKRDHLAVDVDGKVCYFTLEHIQAISNNAKEFRILPKHNRHLNSYDLIGVLKDFKYNWVTINSMSDQELFGVLSNIFEDFIIVINHQELHYIAKSHISNIHKGTFEKEKNITGSNKELNVEKATTNMNINKNTEKTTEIRKENTTQDVVSSLIEEINELDDSKEEVEKYLPEEQIVSVLKDKTNINESEKSNEDANLNVIKHLLELLNSIGQSKIIENSTEVSKEITIQEVISSLIKEINEMDDSKEEVEKYSLQMDQENLLSANNEFEQLIETNSEETIQETTAQKIKPIHATLEETIEVRAHVDEVVDSITNEIKVEQNIQTEPPIRKNEKRILLTPWSKMNYDQNTIAIPPKKTKESSNNIKPPLKKTQPLLEEEQNSPATNEAPVIEEINVLMETQEPTVLVSPQTTVTVLDPRERKAILQKQYYALMRHAEQNSTNFEHQLATNKSFHLSPLENETNNDEEFNKTRMQERKKGEKAMLEKQFNSLMRHAAKMYRQLRDY